MLTTSYAVAMHKPSKKAEEYSLTVTVCDMFGEINRDGSL